jgi:hypothetical protein
MSDVVAFVQKAPPWWWWCAAAAVLGAALLVVLALYARTRHRLKLAEDKTGPKPPRAQRSMYLVALMGVAVSADTSWRFFGDRLSIVGVERVLMFAVVEVALIACAVVMRSRILRGDTPGPARTFLWLLTGASALIAWQLSGLTVGLARVVLGPVVGIWALHIALGVEMRHARVATGTWARIVAELRERTLSWIGLGDDTRDAVVMRQDRAARQAAQLAVELGAEDRNQAGRFRGYLLARRRRKLQRKVRTSNAAHDPRARAVMLAELATLRHIEELVSLKQESPWTTDTLEQIRAEGEQAARRPIGKRVAAARRPSRMTAATTQPIPAVPAPSKSTTTVTTPTPIPAAEATTPALVPVPDQDVHDLLADQLPDGVELRGELPGLPSAAAPKASRAARAWVLLTVTAQLRGQGEPSMRAIDRALGISEGYTRKTIYDWAQQYGQPLVDQLVLAHREQAEFATA